MILNIQLTLKSSYNQILQVLIINFKLLQAPIPESWHLAPFLSYRERVESTSRNCSKYPNSNIEETSTKNSINKLSLRHCDGHACDLSSRSDLAKRSKWTDSAASVACLRTIDLTSETDCVHTSSRCSPRNARDQALIQYNRPS
jgi:hypothetical protein